MIDPYQPDWPPKEAGEEPAASTGGRTDFHSLLAEPEVFTEIPHEAVDHQPKKLRTDFQSLRDPDEDTPVYAPRKTYTDFIIDVLTPFLIFVIVYVVVFYLLDVRYVFTAKHDTNLRFVAACFVVGVVALNRLVARDGSSESVIYMIGLGFAIGFYTFSTTGMYEVGGVARNFMNDNPYVATFFNLCVVGFIWWLTNRLTHECCVDENPTAGEVGILTGTRHRLQKAFQRDSEAEKLGKKKLNPFAKGDEEPYILPMEMQPFDPLERDRKRGEEKEKKQEARALTLSDRLGQRHPGMAIFYFSAMVMGIFAVGLRVTQHGGQTWVSAGWMYLILYTVCALLLLLLTSLGSMREYFRARKMVMPGLVGFFWLGGGLFMLACVVVMAGVLPLPNLPPLADVGEHQVDPYSRETPLTLLPVALTEEELMQQRRFTDRLGQGVLAVFGLLVAFTALKALGVWAAKVARQRDRYPAWVIRLCDRLERVISLLTRLPKPRPRRKKIRVQRSIARSAEFDSSLGHPDMAAQMNTNDHIEYAYAAMCALAHDLGAPKATGQTPYEFIEAFPPELSQLREEAEDLTRLYVMAAYSPMEMDKRLEDRLRKYWNTYRKVRNRYVR